MRVGALVQRKDGSAATSGKRGRANRATWRSTLRSGPRRPRKARAGPIALIAVALLSTVTGLWIMVARLNGPPSELPVSASADGLAVDLHEAGWVAMDAHTMDSQGGFQMPAQMMPGAPAGNEMRLGIALTLVNTADRVREFNLGEEFVLVGGVIDGGVRLHSDTFGQLGHLGPGSAIDGVLYFDTTVPAASDPALVLRWSHEGRSFDLAIPFGGAAPAPHPHGS